MKYLISLFIVFFTSVTFAAAPSSAPDTPFRLGTFEADGMTRVGMVLGEDTILDIRGASAALSSAEDLDGVRMPRNMLSLIENYDRVKARLYQIANYYTGNADGRSFAFKVADVTLRAPIKWPYNLVSAAANYRDHTREMSDTDLKPVDPDVDPPVLFAKSPRSTILDPNSEFPIPKGYPLGRAWDFENELAVIIGKKADSVSIEDAKDYVFGYSIVFDVSARNDPSFPRKERAGFNFGVNWMEGKSRDNAAPFGPYITPKEFIGDSADLDIKTWVNGVQKQDGNSRDMIHDEPHLIRHMTAIFTHYPGDVIMTGTPAGVGTARNPPEFLQPGDVVEMSIENIGTLVTTITEEK
ncbi:MAG: fumarylacetoacetate hydrolase family protein [Kordiimonadaceae bacterium]|nr:fumarylacetoacetate hydrolase family protein [Kordiimonadaceae bacterium]